MAKKTESGRDSFDALKNRFMSLLCRLHAGGDKAISESASAAESLIEGVEKALDELRNMGIDHEDFPKAKEVQS